ncbi:MAG: HAD family hydrolase [Chloroflexi bacterium]|nr:HAD family hydrolase [Chloroflexota bacterium]
MSPIKAVVFDMYETLVSNPERSWIELFEEICRSQGLATDPQTLYREWKALEVGFRRTRLNLEEPEKSPPFKSYEVAWRECFVQVFADMQLEGDAAEAAKAAVRSMGLREPFKEVRGALSVLQQRWVTAILSNADDDYLLPQLKRLDLDFQVVLSSEMVGAYKPHPLPFQRVLEELDLSPQETVYVGDNPFDDVKGAKGVGMGTVWINRYGKELDNGLPPPDYQIESLAELPQILERWN